MERNSGLIAQWIEHPPSKRAVAGSSPAQSDITRLLWQKNPPFSASIQFPKRRFPDSFKIDKNLSWQQQSDAVSRVLLELIQAEAEPCFLLSAVLDFIGRVRSSPLQLFEF